MRPSPALSLLVAALVLCACGDTSGAGGARRVSSDVVDGPGADAGEGCVADRGGAGVRYRVRNGDTLTGIARSVYGDARLWPEIAAANPDVVGPGGNLRIGDELVIPFEGR